MILGMSSKYNVSISGMLRPKAISAAIIEPVLVPNTRSKTSQSGLPATASTSFRTPRVYTPFDPPPSNERTRKSASAGLGGGCSLGVCAELTGGFIAELYHNHFLECELAA